MHSEVHSFWRCSKPEKTQQQQLFVCSCAVRTIFLQWSGFRTSVIFQYFPPSLHFVTNFRCLVCFTDCRLFSSDSPLTAFFACFVKRNEQNSSSFVSLSLALKGLKSFLKSCFSPTKWSRSFVLFVCFVCLFYWAVSLTKISFHTGCAKFLLFLLLSVKLPLCKQQYNLTIL